MLVIILIVHDTLYQGVCITIAWCAVSTQLALIN